MCWIKANGLQSSFEAALWIARFSCPVFPLIGFTRSKLFVLILPTGSVYPFSFFKSNSKSSSANTDQFLCVCKFIICSGPISFHTIECKSTELIASQDLALSATVVIRASSGFYILYCRLIVYSNEVLCKRWMQSGENIKVGLKADC